MARRRARLLMLLLSLPPRLALALQCRLFTRWW